MSERRNIVRDERGAVLLVGLFAAVFLFGAAYFVLGIGDAVEHRETMQDAADTGAYASAVLHARAMNLVAMLNLVKLSVAAAVASLLAVIAGASKTIAWIKSTPGGLAALGAALPLLTATHARALADYSSIRGDTEAVLRAADRAQRTLAERLPEIASTQAGQSAAAYGAPVTRGFSAPRPLPIELGKPLGLCQRALPHARPPALAPFDKVAPERARDRARSEAEAALQPSCLGLGVAAMALESGASLGGDRFQLRYFVLGGSPSARGERGIEVATWRKGDPASDGSLAFAQAEYYYDGEGEVAQKAADGLWSLGWRARFRRFRSPDLAAEMAAACRQADDAPCGDVLSATDELAERMAH
jgi:hypothetical protein